MSKTIHIGVFIPAGAQALDVATVDVLGIISTQYLSNTTLLPSSLTTQAPSVTVSYITVPALHPSIPLTSNMSIIATHIYTDEAVSPGKLDVVVVPGPDPDAEIEEGALAWLRAQAGREGTDVLSVCTGAYVCARAGVVVEMGRRIAGPRGLRGDLERRFPGIRVVGDQQRWVQDGNLWSSGGITNGNDLMAAYARQKDHWACKPLVEACLALADVGDRAQFY